MTDTIIYYPALNKFYDKATREKNDKKSDELDKLKQIEELIQDFNKHPEFHYLLRLLKPVKRAWF